MHGPACQTGQSFAIQEVLDGSRRWHIIQGDARDELRTLPSECVQTCVTSPPYWGLRDYGTGQWIGGSAECDHRGPRKANQAGFNERYFGRPSVESDKQSQVFEPFREVCGKCGARRVDRQLGLEPTPQEYVSQLVSVFRQVRRVLRKDGTLWLNLGDSYATGGGKVGDCPGGGQQGEKWSGPKTQPNRLRIPGLKPKDLVGIPWRVAFALQADGWWLRSEIIWHKPNPMPESITDRPTRAHEYLFLFAKSRRYYYDSEAIREPASSLTRCPRKPSKGNKTLANRMTRGVRGSGWADALIPYRPERRNARSVWTIPTRPYPEAHFATFPEALVEPCVLAGSSPLACGKCGTPWRRETKSSTHFMGGSGRAGRTPKEVNPRGKWSGHQYGTNLKLGPVVTSETLGWKSICQCAGAAIRSCLVLDPFAGAGTTGVVAARHGRRFLGIELNCEYARLARRRLTSQDFKRPDSRSEK